MTEKGIALGFLTEKGNSSEGMVDVNCVKFLFRVGAFCKRSHSYSHLRSPPDLPF